MNKRERFLAAANFEAVERVPRYTHFVKPMHEIMTKFLGKAPEEHFDMDEGVGRGLREPEGFEYPDYSIYHPGQKDGEDGFYIDENGCGHMGGGYFHFTEYISPLRNAQSIKELEDYPVIDKTDWSGALMKEAADNAHAAGNVAEIFVGHMYESAWQIRGYEEFLMDLMVQREWAEVLLDKLCRNNMAAAIAAAKAGYDCIKTGDDVANQNAMMFQPDLWREVMKPRWAKVIAAAREIKPDIHVWYHSDGNISEIIEDLIEIGITILNPVQPECVDPFEVRKKYGKRIAFDGCMGTQTTMPFGSTQDVKDRVKDLVTGLDAMNGGLILSPTHVLEPEVPPENVVAFYEGFEEL